MKENLLGSPGPGTRVLISEKETDIAQDWCISVYLRFLWRKKENNRQRKAQRLQIGREKVKVHLLVNVLGSFRSSSPAFVTQKSPFDSVT